MKTCRTVKAVLKQSLRVAVFLTVSAAAFSAATLKKTDKDPLSVPSMPSISGAMAMPQIGSGFYVPGSRGFYSGSKPQAQAASGAKAGEASPDAENQNEPASENVSSVTKKAVSPLGLGGEKSINQLTASDLSSLNSMGLFGSLGGLLGGNSSSAGVDSILVNQNSQDSKRFEMILNELAELKQQVSASGTELKEAAGGLSGSKKREPKILRFIVNQRDILPTCKKVYFSEQESDGTFLLTGDRKFMSGNKNCSETFYFYFHTDGSEGGITKYKVTPAISQDAKNTGSNLYQLTHFSELKAQRTGNLVTLRAAGGDWNLDILLSLDR